MGVASSPAGVSVAVASTVSVGADVGVGSAVGSAVAVGSDVAVGSTGGSAVNVGSGMISDPVAVGAAAPWSQPASSKMRAMAPTSAFFFFFIYDQPFSKLVISLYLP